jgi:hypothetical protein
LKKICSPGGYNVTHCPINCAWFSESNDTTLDFLAPPEDPHPTLPVFDRIFIEFLKFILTMLPLSETAGIFFMNIFELFTSCVFFLAVSESGNMDQKNF